MIQLVKYTAVFALAAAAAALLAILAIYANIVRNCDRTGFAKDRFVDVCHDERFGDYAHGAFFYDLEPETIKSLKSADVVFLGNSRMQFAFSGPAIVEFFHKRHLRFYMFAMTEGETSRFFEVLMTKYDLHPKFTVINADPFFSKVIGFGDGGSAPALFGAREPVSHVKYLMKMVALKIGNELCETLPAACHNRFITVYRSSGNGLWDLVDYSRLKAIPFKPYVGFDPHTYYRAITGERLSAVIGTAREFFKTTRLRRECVLLTGIPQPRYDNGGLAQALAGALGTKSLNVTVDRMATVDGSHMTRETADRWARQFLSQFDQELTGCGL